MTLLSRNLYMTLGTLISQKGLRMMTVLFGLSSTYCLISFRATLAGSISAMGKKINLIGCSALLLRLSLRLKIEKTCIREHLNPFRMINCFKSVFRTFTNWLR